MRVHRGFSAPLGTTNHPGRRGSGGLVVDR